MSLTCFFIIGLHLAHTSQGYVLLQVRKSDNQSNVDALIHKMVPSHQFEKIADTARKHFKNYKQFKIKSKDDDKELESVVFAIKTKSDTTRQNERRDDNLFSFENIKQKFIDLLSPPDNNDMPSFRAKMEKYNIKPQIIHFRDGKGKPSMMYEVESKSLLQTIKDTIMSKTFKKYADKFVQKAAMVFRTLKDELNKN